MNDGVEVTEPLMDFNCNLPELLAVDLEESSEVFQSRQLTAGAPAPGLADDGATRLYSLQNGFLSPMFPSQQLSATLSGSKSLQTIDQKYSDIFAPLDFNPHKRASISSSEYSAELEPPSVSNGEESLLTVDTLFESDQHPSPTFLRLSSSTKDNTQISWIDLEAEDVPPPTGRRRSSMTDMPAYVSQLLGPDEVNDFRTMSLQSHAGRGALPGSFLGLRASKIIDNAELPTPPTYEIRPAYPVGIPRRRSSLQYREAYIAAQKLAEKISQRSTFADDGEETRAATPSSMSPSLHEDNPQSAFRYKMGGSPRATESGSDLASVQVDVNSWLGSDDGAQFRREGQLPPRSLPPNVLETLQVSVTNFPDTMLQCSSVSIETIRDRAQRLRYNPESPRSDLQATCFNQPDYQQSKPKWKWLGSSKKQQQQSLPDIPLPSIKCEWAAIKSIFPKGRDDHCDALYAHLLAYSYITSLCSRPALNNPTGLPRPTTPWTTKRPNTGRSASSAEPDLYTSTPPRPSFSDSNRIPPKAVSLLGMGVEGALGAPPSVSSNRPSSGGSPSRTSTFTSMRSVPSFFFNGPGQGQGQGHQPRQSESRGSATSAATPATPTGRRRNSITKPMTPSGWRASVLPLTSVGYRGYGQDEHNLVELRHGLATCCAKLVVELRHAGSSSFLLDDEPSEADPMFMRALCEVVRCAEEAMVRSQ
ncbi:hypothetical protein F5Y19DRAFT_393377 [Xylariaceae sp. FL1651]|nr:hypothetical protein F5Y19DRAFT_393377 [Xylariaceae sp. FL1651]